MLKIGGVIVPTSPLFSRAEIVHVAAVTEAVAMIVAAPLLEEVEKARGDLAGVKHIIVIGGEPAEVKAKGCIPYGELLAQGATWLDPVRRDRMAVSALLFTSGTTGLPKGTVHFMEEALTVPDGFGKYGWGVTPDSGARPYGPSIPDMASAIGAEAIGQRMRRGEHLRACRAGYSLACLVR